MIIYKAKNKINDMEYIGQTTTSLRKRISVHKASIGNKETYFSHALKKYKDNFKWKVIEKCNSKEELDEMEFHYIKQYNTLRPNGYNLTLGGEGNVGWNPSKETKRKLSQSNKKYWNKKDDNFRKEWGKRMSKMNSGENNPMYGSKRLDNIKRNCINTYDIISPDGKIFTINNLKEFVNNNDELNYTGLIYHINANTDNYKGWRCRRYE